MPPQSEQHDDLVGALYHALQRTDACDRYVLDAEGKQELATFIRTAQRSHAEIVEQATKLPGVRTAGRVPGRGRGCHV